MTYDIDYFIEFFEEIPEEKFVIGAFSDSNGCRCASGHLHADILFKPNVHPQRRLYHPGELKLRLIALQELLRPLDLNHVKGGAKVPDAPDHQWETDWYPMKLEAINDGWAREYPQASIKRRVLAALQDAKQLQQKIS